MNELSSPNVPMLTMSSLEIAGLTGKRHQEVLRDIRKMGAELNMNIAQFSAKIETGRRGRPAEVCNLPKRETLILVSGYSTEMRARIIDRWMELEAIVAQPVASFDMTPETRQIIGGIVKQVVHSQLATILPTMAASFVNEHYLTVSDGLTAGEVCAMSRVADKFPRGIATRVSRRLSEFCQRHNETPRVSRLGRVRALTFPTHRVRDWLDLEGRALIRRWMDERKGQGVLRLVQS